MSADPNKKTPRTFQCRDVLWDTFQQMAQELECSVDYLVNEAMKQYARQRHGLRGPLSRPGDASAPPPAPGSVPPGHGAGLPPPPPPGRKSASLPPPPSARTSVAPQGRLPPPIGAPHPPPPPLGGPGMSRAPAVLSRGAPPPPPPIAPPPPPPPPFSAGPGSPQKLRTAASSQQNYGGQLTAIYDGERVVVNKDRFVIGRGKQTSDLTIKDPNVSRQHAMVEFLNGQYYMVDMGSTNGVEHNGQRVTRRPIGEGDSYRICEHEIRFTYR